MTQHEQLIRLLKTKDVRHKLIKAPASNSLEQHAKQLNNTQVTVLRSVFLRSGNNAFLAILPFNELIDFTAASSITGQKTTVIPQKDCLQYYSQHNNHPSLPIEPQGISKTLVAKSIERFEFVIFESGKSDSLIQITAKDLLKLTISSTCLHFTVQASTITFPTPKHSLQDSLTPDAEKRSKLERLYKLPAMPQMASELILLKNDDNAHANDLAKLIQNDPSLTAQIIRYAKSAFFNYQGDINSVNEAISRVIGFESVINIALGLSVGKKLKNPPDGPLGLNEFWKHAVYSATLAQSLSKKIPKEIRPKQDLAYLSGLLHNFGFLLLGHLFQPEFFLLNRLYASNLSRPITCIEKHALGMGAGQNAINMGHSELGAWLLEKWQLPKEVVVSAREHHNIEYEGEHKHYATLIALVNNALGLHNLGDHREETLNEDLCTQLGIKPSVVYDELESVMQQSDQIDIIIKQFAA